MLFEYNNFSPSVPNDQFENVESYSYLINFALCWLCAFDSIGGS